MLFDKKVSIGNFLKKGIDFEKDDVVVIANEGKIVKGQFGNQNVFLIKLANGQEGNVSFNQTTINNLVEGFGRDSINWVGKSVKVMAILSNVQGKMIDVYYFLHPETELNKKTGQFTIPDGSKFKADDIPVIEEE